MSRDDRRTDLFARRLVLGALTLGLALVASAVPVADGGGTLMMARVEGLWSTVVR